MQVNGASLVAETESPGKKPNISIVIDDERYHGFKLLLNHNLCTTIGMSDFTFFMRFIGVI